MRRVMDTVEMPDRLAENLIMFIRQNDGTLSRRRREGEFAKLRDDEVRTLEDIVREAFEGYRSGKSIQMGHREKKPAPCDHACQESARNG